MSTIVSVARTVRRGQVYWVVLDPIVGSEQAGRRPCIIVSPNAVNRIEGFPMVSVVPVTTKGEQDSVRLPVSTGGIVGFALVHQVRSLDKRRLETLSGELEPRELAPILTRLQQFFQP